MTTWLVASAGSDANGGTSKTVRSSGGDAIVNATAGTTKVTSITASWTGADVGHGICVAGKFRLISAVQAGTSFTVTTTNSSATVSSSGLFTSSMVGQAITGPGIQPNSVITVFTNVNTVTISIAASTGFGTGTATLYPMATTTGNVVLTAGTAQAWVVGGMWATWGNSFLSTNSPITNSDTVYVGPGVYREAVTANLTSPTAMVNITGDVDGAQTGMPPGEVRLTSFTATDYASTSAVLALTLGAKNFLTFSNIHFVGAGGSGCVSGNSGHDVSFIDCAFYGLGGAISYITVASIAANVLVDRCVFGPTAATVVQFSLALNASADYDANIIVRNCLFTGMSTGSGVNITSSGGGSFKGGGVHIRGCTIIGGLNAVSITTANVSSTFPCSVRDCLILSQSGFSLTANTVGQIVEDYNIIIVGNARSSVTTGFHSVSSVGLQAASVHFGQERIWGGLTRPFGTPANDSTNLGWAASPTSGNDTIPTVDLLNRPRPGGTSRLATSGTLTAGGTATATDSGAAFGNDGQLNGFTLAIASGTGSGQTMMIKSHTQTVITVYGTWNTQPDNTSTYQIYSGSPAFYGKATSATATTLTQANATWDTNLWQGFTLEITAGTGSGQISTVVSNTGTVITVPAFSPSTPDNTSVYKLYRKTSETAANNAAGALERHDTAGRETVLTDAGGIAWNLYGWGDQEIYIPVSTFSTTITVKCSFDTAHGNTNKPQAILLADGETGVATQTVTATGTAGSGTFETLSFSAFTPTTAGFVILRLVGRSNSPTGRAIFDTLSVS